MASGRAIAGSRSRILVSMMQSWPDRWRRAGAVRGIDALAHEGFSRGAGWYDRARPGYPLPAIGWVCSRLGIARDSRVLDLGAGTGKLACLVQDVSEAEVVAVEPVAAMREIARRSGLEVLDGTAERLPLAGGSVDAVVCGEAFHWFDGACALNEIARVLRAGGSLGLLWNVHTWDRDAPWVRALERLIGPYSDRRAETRYGSGRWRAAFERDARWSALERKCFCHELRLDASALVDHVGSVAFVAALPDPERAALLAEVERIAGDLPGAVTIPYRTDVYITGLVTPDAPVVVV
jgi:SAM-dependent methyltransferase